MWKVLRRKEQFQEDGSGSGVWNCLERSEIGSRGSDNDTEGFSKVTYILSPLDCFIPTYFLIFSPHNYVFLNKI